MRTTVRTPPGAPWAAAAAMAALGACALYVHRQTLRAERAFPVKGRLVDVNGVRLHCIEHGPSDAAHTVVVLHGDGSMAEEVELSGLPALIARHHRVIVIDRPGFGLSTATRPHFDVHQQADLVAAALERLGVRRAIVVGHSYGALVALALGLAHPHAVGSLVLASGYYFPTVRFDAAWLSLPALPVVGPLFAHTIAPLLARVLWRPMARRMFAPAGVTEAFERYPAWMSARPSQLQAAAAESASLIPTVLALRRRYAELKVPVVIVAGAGDRHVNTRWHSGRLHRLLDFSWLRIVEGAGHMVHHVAPAQVVAAIDQAASMGASLPRVPLAGDRDGETAHVVEREQAEAAAQASLDLGRS
jgi:pimeloyl-ACP methyl ester carboxylesterase